MRRSERWGRGRRWFSATVLGLASLSSACALIAGLEEKSRPAPAPLASGSGGVAGTEPGTGGSKDDGGVSGGAAGDMSGMSGAAGLRPPSCGASAPGAAYDCGASGVEDCCESPLVDGGPFDRYGDGNYPFTVSSFRLDRFEVTVARFRAFQNAVEGGYRPVAGSGKRSHLRGGAAEGEAGWLAEWNTQLGLSLELCEGDNYTAAPGPNEYQPVTCASYYQAVAFCIWDGGFLPTSNELLYVTVGGSAMRTFPWGEALDATRAVYSTPSVADVGTKPDGKSAWGQEDIIGNVWEIVLDNVWVWHDHLCISDCAAFDDGIARVFAIGGSFESSATSIRDMTSRDLLDRSGNDETGFRCARAP